MGLAKELQRVRELSEDLSFAGAQSGEGINAWKAFRLAQDIETKYGKNKGLDKIYPNFARPIHISTDPPGALVQAKAYKDKDSLWFTIGTTPLDSVVFPYGYSNLKLEREGYETQEDVIWNSYLKEDAFRYKLLDSDSSRKGMVFVHLATADKDSLLPEAFWMDRFEVTNREFKRFVDAGGYQKEDYWEYPIYRDERLISWNSAME